MGGHPHARLAVIASVVVCGCWASAAPQAPRDIEALMAHVSERVADYPRRARNVICLEQSTVQPIQGNWAPEGFARTVESELRVEFETTDGDTPPEAKDSGSPAHQRRWRWTKGPDARIPTRCRLSRSPSSSPRNVSVPLHLVTRRPEKDRASGDRRLRVDEPDERRADRDERRYDDCLTGRARWHQGRVWVDAVTHEVLRVERASTVPSTCGPREAAAPLQFLPGSLERDDLTLRQGGGLHRP